MSEPPDFKHPESAGPLDYDEQTVISIQLDADDLVARSDPGPERSAKGLSGDRASTEDADLSGGHGLPPARRRSPGSDLGLARSMENATLRLLRGSRAKPPHRATEDPLRRGIYGASLEQFEQLLRAAEAVGPAARPLPLFLCVEPGWQGNRCCQGRES
jgi:hypothetical protein